MMMMLIIAGGVALLVFGVRFLRKGLDRLFGRRLGLWVQRAGSGRFRAFLTGLSVAALLPSSTTISMLAVQAVQARQMSVIQMLAVMLGANIGLTVMVQIVALELDLIAPPLILVGVVLFQYTRRPRLRGIGQVVLSLGLIFLALGLIKGAVPADLDPDSDLATVIRIAGHYPLLLLLVATALTMLLQSSTATIGLVIGLVSGGVATSELAVPAVLGANVGMAATTLIIGWSQVESRRLALGNLGLKTIIALVGVAFAPLMVSAFARSAVPMSTLIALLHTGFNVIVAIVGLPLLSLMARALVGIIPNPRAGEEDPRGAKYIGPKPPDSPALGLGLSLKEITRVSEIVRGMYADLWVGLERNDERLVTDVARRDDQVDLLDEEIKRYLTTLLAEDNERIDQHEQMLQLRYLSELETIGDIIDKNLCELVRKKIHLGAEFSEEGWADLCEFHRLIGENLLIAEAVFTTRDPQLAEQLLRHKERVRNVDQDMRDRHFARLTQQMRESHETSSIHLDLLTHLKRINSTVSQVAHAILRGDERHAFDHAADRAD